MKLKGNKIYLKTGLKHSDYKKLLKYFTDIEVMRYICFAKKTVNFNKVGEVIDFWKGRKDVKLFGIYTRKGKFIGYTDIIGGKKSREFGIIIGDKKYWGKGIGFEATKLILDYCFNKLKLNKVTLTTSEFNKRAIKLYKKLGFKTTKTIPKGRVVFYNNKWLLSGTIAMETKKEKIIKSNKAPFQNSNKT